MHQEEFMQLLAFYQGRGAASDQNELIQLLRETQQLYGGVIPKHALEEIARALGFRASFLPAVLKRYPSIKTEAVRHSLTVCQGPSCGRRRELLDFLSRAYGVEPGGVAAAGFRLQSGGCMKNCGRGPCVRWDGTVYTGMTPESLRALIEKK